MYNEARKQDYIKIAKQGNKELERILTTRFTKTEPIERRLRKDLCEWTAPEILDYYKSMVTRSLESLLVIHSSFNQYAQWCLSNLFMEDSQNHFEEIDREILNAECINKAYLDHSIVTREELLQLLRNPAIKNVFEKFLLLAVFEGIGGKGYSDFLDLRMENFKGDKVILPGREITVSAELKNYAQIASEEYEYEQKGSGVTVSRTGRFDPADDRIIKATKGTNLHPELPTYRHKMIVRMKKMEEEYSCPAFNNAMLFESGRLEMVRYFMQKDKTDAITAIKAHDEEIALQYARIYGRERYVDKWANFLYLTD